MIQEVFGKTEDGREVLAFTLTDGAYRATVLNYGGILQSLFVPCEDGNQKDILLGYHTVAEYEKNGGYLGALIGRFGNRIGLGKFTLDGREYALYCNDRGNHLHGGKVGFNRRIWKHEFHGEELVLTLVSPDGDEGYPGTLSVQVTYSLAHGELRIAYRAVSDKKTVINLTNHAYFNLNGEGDGSILDNELCLESDCITPTNDTMIPLGGFRAVAGTPFDFTSFKPIGKEIGEEDADLLRGNGYDHCYVIRGADGTLRKCAEARSAKTGIHMECLTDLPAVQFYAGNGLHQQGKTCYYGKRAGFCLETQAIPNNPNVPEYARLGTSVLEAGETYSHVTVYKFHI